MTSPGQLTQTLLCTLAAARWQEHAGCVHSTCPCNRPTQFPAFSARTSPSVAAALATQSGQRRPGDPQTATSVAAAPTGCLYRQPGQCEAAPAVAQHGQNCPGASWSVGRAAAATSTFFLRATACPEHPKTTQNSRRGQNPGAARAEQPTSGAAREASGPCRSAASASPPRPSGGRQRDPRTGCGGPCCRGWPP